MSKYTTQIRWYCESFVKCEEKESLNVDDILLLTHSKVFDFDYPIFDVKYKTVLECKILKWFYVEEIGFETFGLFKLRLNATMNRIMPYYNQLYKSALIEYNPLTNKDLTKTHNLKNDKNTDQKDNSTTRSDNWNYYQNTPQGELSGVEQLNYLTSAQENKTENEQSYISNKKQNTLEDYLEHIAGKDGTATYSSMIRDWRSTFLNIDSMIIDELESLFMGVW